MIVKQSNKKKRSAAHYLRVMSRFHNYSYSNSLLIAMQKPDASLLQGYQGWIKNFKRHVKSGEKGIKIFAPAPIKTKQQKDVIDPETNQPVLDENGDPVKETVEVKIPKFKVVTVFDVSQTDGEPLPELGIHNLTGNVNEYNNFMEAIKRTAKIPIAFEDIQTNANGYYHKTDDRIAIKAGMSEAQTVKTAIHELTHSRLDRLNQSHEKEEPQKDRATREVIAESCAFTVANHFGLDTSEYSFGYVATWSANKELPELKAFLQEIRSESAAMINEIESHLADIEKEQALESTIPIEDSLEQLTTDLSNFSYEYDPYNYFDTVDNAEAFIQDIEESLSSGNVNGIKEWLQSIVDEDDDYSVQASSLLERIETFTSNNLEIAPETTQEEIIFYASECAEFEGLGELHENLTLEEALKAYDQIPTERLNAIKCVGFEVSAQ